MKTILLRIKPILIACKENEYQAKIFRPNFLFSILIVLFLARIVILPFYIHFPKSVFFAEVVSTDIVSLLNQQRKSLGLNPLIEDSQLNRAAGLKAQDMIEQDYFGHRSPNGIPAWHFIQASGYEYEVAGENLAIGFLDSSEVHKAWNNSPLHKQNLLDSRFKQIGVAVLEGEFQGSRTTVVVQLFGQPKLPAVPVAVASEIPIEPVTDPIAEPQEFLSNTNETEFLNDQETVISDVKPLVKVQVSNIERFFITKYDQIIQGVVFSLASLLTMFLVFNAIKILTLPFGFRSRINILKNSLDGGLVVACILLFLGSVDKSLIVQFIPHNLMI